MTQEDKQLLLKDLCARLPYGVICHYNCVTPIEGRELRKANCKDVLKGIIPASDGHIGFMVGFDKVNALEGDIKPYLRPLSSMTEDERKELKEEHKKDERIYAEVIERIANGDEHARGTAVPHFAADWCNKNHFDYRGLIEKGLALEAPKRCVR